jgi:hypothetical protein
MAQGGIDITLPQQIVESVSFYVPFILIIAVGLSVGYMLWQYFKRNKYYAKILFIKSRNETEIHYVPLGELTSVKIGQGTYNLTETEPIFLQTFFGRQPMYLIHKDTVLGLKINAKDIKPIHKPDVITKMIESEVAKDLVSGKLISRGIDIIQIALGIPIGMVLLMLMIYGGWITI